MNLRRAKQWGIEFWYWLAEAKLVLMGVLVLFATFLFGFITWHNESSIRIAGYLLQLVGMIFAIRGLLGIREHFGQPLLRGLILKWIKRLPKWKKSVVVGVGTGHVSIDGMKAYGEVWSPDDPKKPIEDRIQSIISNLDRIRASQREHTKLIDELKDSHEIHKKHVAAESEKLKDDIQSNLESLHTSDLITSLVGLVWLTVGITLSTLAPEISQWL